MSELIERTINNINLLVNANKPNEIFFEKEVVESHPDISNITPVELCKIIAGNNFTPLLMSWEILDKCSFSCPFCYIVGHSNHKLVRFKETKKHIDDLIDRGLLYCTLTGGEATLHPDFIEIYKYLKLKGVLVEIYTNGSLIADHHIELFKEFPPFKIEITIYGISSSSFSDATGTNKFDYQMILKNIVDLKDAGINIICKTPLNVKTVDEFDDIQAWCEANHVKFYYSTNIFDGYDGENLDKYAVKFDQQIKYEALKFESIYKQYPTDFENNKRSVKSCYTCSIRNYGLHINSAFEMMPCSETHLTEAKTNILENSIDIGIKKYRDFVTNFFDKPIVGCSGCEASSICKMCTAKAKPIKNTNDIVTDFKVPEHHCETQRKKVLKINDYIIQNSNY